MRFFGYYALHSFVNQIRKLFKTWVLVFILVCFVLGGLIGFGAAMLADKVEENSEPETVETAEEPEEETPPLIETDALIELIAGGVVLGLFFFEAVGADKNGGKIFLPADVNLLFPSPMKPQSVLMFRLATQLGTALLASLYLVFQLPNLVLNAGLSWWAAGGILIAWFAAIFIGKLIQVLLYTVCSTKPRFKDFLRRGIYAVGIVLAGSFLVYYKASGQQLLVSADRFFNAEVSRYIPFWGWLKALPVLAAQQRWGAVCVYLLLLIAGGTALVWGIWRIDADFYEDAMAKSEETAALLEKASSEKTSGTAATRQRKKERKDSILRDGLRYGQGANIFFFKTMYNRFRFAHLHFFTKTMETYFVAALGSAAAMRFFFDSTSILPTALILGGLVFFRALGNPLAEDTGLDYFRMIPESTWQKLFFSLLGGTVCCLMDLLLPMLAAGVLLGSPLKLLLWLPLIVSVDFYSTSVATFIDLSVPASIGKTIKQLVQILFIYFGLLPDAAILAVGIVSGASAAAAIGTTVLNLLLGLIALSLASVFLQPKGRSVAEAVQAQDLKAARDSFSRMGVAVFAILAVTVVLQLGLGAAADRWLPAALDNSWGIWLFTFVPQYLVAMPIGLYLMRKVPAYRPEKHPLGWARGFKFLFICVFFMYGGNLVGTVITSVIGLLRGAVVENPLMNYLGGENLFAQILVMVILAPLLEEFIFRKQLIDRLRIYGGKTAVLLSALLFGLFHGNFSQFFYAFALGLAFGYIYQNTGRLRNTVIAHMCINFMGSVFAPMLLERLPLQSLSDGAMDLQALLSPWMFAYFGYVMLLLFGSVLGLVLLCVNARNLTFCPGALELPAKKRLRTVFGNVGMILAVLGCVGMMAYSLL